MLSVVIVNYNVKYYVGQCLDSLQRALQGIDAEILIVDNHSKDGSVDYLQGYYFSKPLDKESFMGLVKRSQNS